MPNYMNKINKIKKRNNSRLKNGSSKNEINFTTGFEQIFQMRADVVSKKLSQDYEKLLPEDIETIEQLENCLELDDAVEDFEWGLDKKMKLHLAVKFPDNINAQLFMACFRMWQDERAKTGLSNIKSVHGRLSGLKLAKY